jgi:hypothetical protein
MANRWVNLVFYVLGSASTAAALIQAAAFAPYAQALTAFGAALLAVGRWDKLLNGDNEK